jgi:hypothetical protein
MILNITGLGHSGKSLIYDILNNVKSDSILPASVEFELIRMPNGFLDLIESIKYGSDPIRFNYILSNMICQLERMANQVSLVRPWSYFIYTGHNYNTIYGEFYKDLINELKSFEFLPKKYERLDVLSKLSSPVWTFMRFKLGLIRNNIPKSSIPYLNLTEIVDFLHYYIYKFYRTEKNGLVILNNAFDIFSIDRPCVRDLAIPSIIVVRDPRDIWLSLNSNGENYTPSWEKNSNSKIIKENLWPSDLNNFIIKYKSYMLKINNLKNDHLILKFEDLCLYPQKSIDKISDYIKVDIKIKDLEKTVYNSKQNVGLWRKSNNNISLISKELKQFLYE